MGRSAVFRIFHGVQRFTLNAGAETYALGFDDASVLTDLHPRSAI